MYYDKKRNISSAKKAAITVKDFSSGLSGYKDEELLALDECADGYNFETAGGVLKDGQGVKRANFGGACPKLGDSVKPLRLYYYKRYDDALGGYEENLLVYAEDGYIYRAKTTDADFSKVESLRFSSPPYAVPYNYLSSDVMIFSDGDKIVVYDGQTATSATDVPSVTSMCIHSERLFATEGGAATSLWFSDDFDPLNWKVSLDEAGFVDIREGCGGLLKAISFGGYVYVFATYGIVRVTAYGDQTEFCVDGIAASSGKIFGGSITVCGDRIIYLAADGFYSFAGGTPTRIMRGLDGKLSGVNNDGAKGCYYNGCFYCKMRAKTHSGERDVLLKYDVHKNSFCLSCDLGIQDMTVMDGEGQNKLLFIISGKKYPAMLSDKAERFSVALEKKWTSGKSDLGKTCLKSAVRLSLFTATDVVVTVKSEYGSRLLRFCGSKERQSLPIGLKGDNFSLTISSRSLGARISSVKIEYEY